MRTDKPILLVEDDQIDAMTVKRALNEIKIKNPIVTAQNGEEALEYLNDEGNEVPCLILLDLNMPKMNGIEFLNVIKHSDKHKQRMIPVIVLTTSKDDQDKIETFKLSVAGYMVKPVDYLQFVETMKAIELYWSLSEMPQ